MKPSPETPESPVVKSIDKVAWVCVERGRVLCVRSHGQDAFYLPGGKREAGESDETCLQREIREELDVALRPQTLRPLGVFEAQAHGKPDGTRVRVTCYAAEYDGEPRASAEIAECAWLTHAERERCSLTGRLILDALHARGEID